MQHFKLFNVVFELHYFDNKQDKQGIKKKFQENVKNNLKL